MKRDEIETISYKTIRSVSFVCSFGYKVLYMDKGKTRLYDRYYLRNLDTGEHVSLLRKEFYSHCKKTFGNLRKGEPPALNACELEYTMF